MMKLTMMARTITPQFKSPALYQTDRGTYVIQGYKVCPAYREQAEDLAASEDLIEVPQALLDQITQVIR